ncbi:MAG: hypothetical protein ACRCVY_06680 [Commensalibacter sp.]
MKRSILLTVIFGIWPLSLYAQNSAEKRTEQAGNWDALNDLKKIMPAKVTINGKRIFYVRTKDICASNVELDGGQIFTFYWKNWPESHQIDHAGYTTFEVRDSENNLHLFRTDEIKGADFLVDIRYLSQSCKNRDKIAKKAEERASDNEDSASSNDKKNDSDNNTKTDEEKSPDDSSTTSDQSPKSQKD